MPPNSKTDAQAQITQNDERNRVFGQLAVRNSYRVLTLGVLFVSGHQLLILDRGEPLLVGTILAVLSVLFLLLKRLQLNDFGSLDERQRYLMGRSYIWAYLLVLGGMTFYMMYAFFTSFPVDATSHMSGRIVTVPTSLSILVGMYTRFINDAVPDSEYTIWQAAYWLNVCAVVFLSLLMLAEGLLVSGWLSLLWNPGWLFIAATMYASVLVVRHTRQRSGETGNQ